MSPLNNFVLMRRVKSAIKSGINTFAMPSIKRFHIT